MILFYYDNKDGEIVVKSILKPNFSFIQDTNVNSNDTQIKSDFNIEEYDLSLTSLSSVNPV